MPRLSIKKVTFKKRRARRSSKSRRFSRTLSRRRPTTYNINVGIGLSKKVRLTYHEEIGFACSSGLNLTHKFNVAGIFDPDVTGIGHQPYGHDQWATLYKHYFVNSADVTVIFRNIATNNIPHNVYIVLDKDGVVSISHDTRMERTKGVGAATFLANSNNKQTVRLRYDAKKFYDIKSVKDEHQLRALFSADPVKPAYLVVGMQPVDSVSSSAAIVYAAVTINYNVTLIDPIPFSGS